MIKKIIRVLPVLLLISGLMFFSSCSDSEDLNEDFILEEIEDVTALEVRSLDKGGCFEIQWPINVQVGDALLPVSSKEDIKALYLEWKANGGDRDNRPKIDFPISVEVEDGEILSIESARQLRRLAKHCKRGDRDKRSCFKLDFPLSLAFPDGTSSSYEKRFELIKALKQWKKDNPDSAEHPSLVFPVTVTYKDGSQGEANDKEALQALREACE